jgi:hypothetical protein
MAIELWDFRSDVGQERTDLRGMSVEALDGGVGKVDEVVQEPGASFLVVDTGPWILGKKVLLPAGLVSGIDVDDERVRVEAPDPRQHHGHRRQDRGARARRHRPVATGRTFGDGEGEGSRGQGTIRTKSERCHTRQKEVARQRLAVASRGPRRGAGA